MEIMQDSAGITVFVCANCARPAKNPAAAVKGRPDVPDFNWPVRAKQVIVPCTGRLQPEHVLKAFEAGSSVVSVIACKEDNCHYIEGSRRCSLRLEYIRSILNEIGLGDGRLLISYLPGTASEDLALSAGKAAPGNNSDSLETQIAAIRERVAEALRIYPPNPLHQTAAAEHEEGFFEGEATVSKDNMNE